jgi:DNA-binding NarL/FixJ family response regulator
LSEGSGIEVMRTVNAEYPDIKVIVASNFADPIYQRYFANAGAHAFFDKSLELRKVRSALEYLASDEIEGRHRDSQSDDAVMLATRV